MQNDHVRFFCRPCLERWLQAARAHVDQVDIVISHLSIAPRLPGPLMAGRLCAALSAPQAAAHQQHRGRRRCSGAGPVAAADQHSSTTTGGSGGCTAGGTSASRRGLLQLATAGSLYAWAARNASAADAQAAAAAAAGAGSSEVLERQLEQRLSEFTLGESGCCGWLSAAGLTTRAGAAAAAWFPAQA